MPAPRLSVVETRMKELFDVELNHDDRKMSRDELVDAMMRADVLVPCVTDKIDAGVEHARRRDR